MGTKLTPILLAIIGLLSSFLLFQNCAGGTAPNDKGYNLASVDGDDEVLNEEDAEDEALAITSFSPLEIAIAGKTDLDLFGVGFRVTDKIYINDVLCPSSFVSSSELTCNVPAVATAQSTMIRVERADGSESVEKAGFRYVLNPAPVTPLCSRASTSKVTVEQTIDFPATTAQCKWGLNGNLTKAAGGVRARREITRNIKLPSKAEVCDASIRFRDNSYQFDDTMFLTLNGRVLMASHGFVDQLAVDPVNRLRIYDFANVLISKSANGTYCPSGDTCRVVGAVGTNREVDVIPSLATIRKALTVSKTGTHTFRLIVTGDDDDTDCMQNGIRGTVEIVYDL